MPIPIVERTSQKRPIELMDVVEMRDATALSVSPDGSRVAFRVRKLDHEANTERAAWYVADIDEPGHFLYVGDGGEPDWEFITNESHQRLLLTQAGWSPDGRKLVYLAKRSGELQLWVAHTDGSGSEQLTRNPADVSGFAWVPQTNRIVFMTGLPRAAREAAIRDKQMHGVRLQNGATPPTQLSDNEAKALEETWDAKRDDYSPLLAQRWEHSRYLPKVEEFWSIDVSSREERKATPQEIEALSGSPKTGFDLEPTATLISVAPHGQQAAFTKPIDETPRFVRNDYLYIRDAGGSVRRLCEAEACSGRITALSWSRDESQIYFQRREGTHYDTMGFYAADPATGRVRTILKTTDMLVGDWSWFRGACPFVGDRAVCIREAPTVPTQVVSISLRDGTLTTLVDLNPEFRNIELLDAERIDWRVDEKELAYGWLVKPEGYVAGRKYPVVLIPNRQRGFLRGGDGDEYPTQLLARNGFVVLSYMYNNLAGIEPDDGGNAYQRHKYGYEAYQRTVESAIDLLKARGLIEETCVGLTGMSDTADKGTYVITHSTRIAAASISGGSIDPTAFILQDKQLQAWLTAHGLGYPDPQGPYWKNWLELSPALNAHRTRAPLLLHAPDSEILLSVELFRQLIELNKPVELFVYYEEPHFKVQPRHLLEINERNLDWFNFWLRGVEDAAPAKQEQYERWRSLRKLTPTPGCAIHA
ncbi:Atxe2 family lasso peptide isopeptidase [Luteimonas sp. SJ-92]|uniref:Atxe2 family lasso peptide isopeptidase n=1 Tax=Luteimonas salinisoli TaxID=2752307 RepID=A0A853JFT8_9GAMM|nr:Atxe2 family lasso peptide isopeptidase [Luteimonas salinisoli]